MEAPSQASEGPSTAPSGTLGNSVAEATAQAAAAMTQAMNAADAKQQGAAPYRVQVHLTPALRENRVEAGGPVEGYGYATDPREGSEAS